MTVFTDTMDVSTKISLYEYGIIRNPKTNKCVVCTNVAELNTSSGNLMSASLKPKIKVKYIGFFDVGEALENVSLGYFDYIGRYKDTILAELDDAYLTAHIYSLEQYCGYFGLF